MSALQQVARHVVTDGPASNYDHIHPALLLQQGFLDVLGTLEGRTDGMQAELLVSIGTLGIVDTGNDPGYLEDDLGDLGGHDVAVVAFGHGDEAIGILHAGPPQDIGIGAVADHLVALEIVREHASRGRARELVWVPIDDDDLMTRPAHAPPTL